MANDKTGASGPRITVVIPTRERADVFASALKTVTIQDYGNLDILVSDNFSGDTTEEIARGTGTPCPLSQHRPAAQHVAQLGIRPVAYR